MAVPLARNASAEKRPDLFGVFSKRSENMLFSFFVYKTTKRYSFRKIFAVLSIILRLQKKGTEFLGNDHYHIIIGQSLSSSSSSSSSSSLFYSYYIISLKSSLPYLPRGIHLPRWLLILILYHERLWYKIIITSVIITVIIVVIVVDDDAYYWVYLSSDHPFQVHYIKCDSLFYDKIRQIFYCKVHQVSLLGASGITKCDGYHKVRQNMV